VKFAQRFQQTQGYQVDIEAAVNDALMVVFNRQIHYVETVGNGGMSWLMMVVANKVRDALKTEYALKRGGGNIGSTDVIDWENETVDARSMFDYRERNPADVAVISEAGACLSRYLDMLPEDHREVVKLHLTGLSYREIAKRTGLSFGKVHKVCGRAISSLRQAFAARRSA
jgi:RNA polymerase sigma factor (sigma-70 family)